MVDFSHFTQEIDCIISMAYLENPNTKSTFLIMFGDYVIEIVTKFLMVI